MAFFIISSSTSLNAPRTFQKSFYDFIELMFENKIEVLKGFGFIDSETDHYKTPQQIFERGRVVFLLRGEFNDIKKMTTKINDLIDLINRFKELDKKELDRLTKDLNNFVNSQIKKSTVHKSVYQLYVSQLSNLNNFCIFKKNLNEILNDCYEVNEVNYADLFFDPGPFAVSEMLSFKKYPEANKLFIYYMISMYEIESYSGITYDNRPILDYNLISHSPSMKNLRTIYNYLVPNANSEKEKNIDNLSSYERVRKFLPNIDKKSLTINYEKTVADCLIKYLKEKIEVMPEPKDYDKGEFDTPYDYLY